MRVLIDVEAGLVRLGTVDLRGQWVDLYAAMACTPARQGYVNAEAIARVGVWRHKASASVGKEIARHLAWLERMGFRGLVASLGRTKAWRLVPGPGGVRFRPNRGAAVAWLRARSDRGASPEEWTDALGRLVEATLALQDGDAERALERLDARSLAGDSSLEAWAALLRGRAALQHDDAVLLERLHEAWFHRRGTVGRTVAARLRALVALQRRFSEPAAALASLGKLAADLELSDDVGALAVVLNVMGLLARRAGDPLAGTAHHLRAAALFGISGDYPSLEGALFNLAKSRHTLLASQGRPTDGVVLRLVELSQHLCRRLGIGGASAQSEICIARWALEMGDMPRARRSLAEAEALVKRIESTFDQACFLLLRAELEERHPTGASDPRRDLRSAERLFLKAGDERSAAEARRMRQKLTRE